ncbi:MAG: thioesterase family protein [Cellvibrionales bacterium]|nr:thioesterase family protein [Cellvibrionales bacterium]
MPRIILDTLTSTLITYPVKIRYSDINTARHVGNDKMISLIQEARIELLTQLGFKNDGDTAVTYVVADLGVNYKAEAFFADELIIEVGVSDIKEKSFDVLYKVTNTKTHHVVAEAKTGLVFLDANAGKTTQIPAALLTAIDKLSTL